MTKLERAKEIITKNYSEGDCGLFDTRNIAGDWMTTIYADGELDEEATHKKYLLVRQEGKRQVKREIDHYNLDMIIALGYRGRRQELLYPHETRISSSDDFSRLISCLIQF